MTKAKKRKRKLKKENPLTAAFRANVKQILFQNEELCLDDQKNIAKIENGLVSSLASHLQVVQETCLDYLAGVDELIEKTSEDTEISYDDFLDSWDDEHSQHESLDDDERLLGSHAMGYLLGCADTFGVQSIDMLADLIQGEESQD